jgi:carboxymethylenebutenolidase
MRRIVPAGLGLLISAAVLPAQDWALANLQKSSRHQEWAAIKNGEQTVHAFVVYPERRENATAVVVIHENRGLTDWVRSVADQLASHGYLAIAPDLLSGMAPGGGRTTDFANEDAAREGIYKLNPDRVTADLQAVADYVAKLPAANGKVAVAGFCWGGSQSFRFATNRARLAAAFVFYGSGPESAGGVRAPVFGFYGGNDARVNATIPQSKTLMEQAGQKYDPVVYEGAGHGFMRSGEEPNANAANRKAREEAWQRWLAELGRL